MTNNRHFAKKAFLLKILKCPKFGNRKPAFARLRPDKPVGPRSWFLKIGFRLRSSNYVGQVTG
jgi:hypothetical protein